MLIPALRGIAAAALALGLSLLPVQSAPRSTDPAADLADYHRELDAFRKEFGGSHPMPDVPFFQFGMGSRTKYLFQAGVLRHATSGETVANWNVRNLVIVPSAYLVSFQSDAQTIQIVENEAAVWIDESGRRSSLQGTETPVHLPAFAGRPYARVLRVLHHEILINIKDGLPLPNFYVYKKPWYRDGAMMAMSLQRTGNLDCIRDWILGLDQPFDRNNAGEAEADNPGQTLFLLSLATNKAHPLVPKLREALQHFQTTNAQGMFVQGRSDFALHPVYQTKWAKFGLRALGLPDSYVIPAVRDSYSSLFWMDYRDAHVAGGEATDRNSYPYLGWATDHFQRVKKSPISNRDYPLTWETQASQADYDGMRIISPIFVTEKTATPHTWHAAEIFLYLLDAPARVHAD